ncbi:hypothetical protein Hypma_001687 [Hypsizygus marmoreus]|uniref:Uncharacterized protein n=1 Tax=Hypsizygus marmoreus TaxID=39966 RepID=A0A369JEU2_HYPMA|nr:hypothetical protein Hypma_001687 [Hypsizygus marmoreus]
MRRDSLEAITRPDCPRPFRYLIQVTHNFKDSASRSLQYEAPHRKHRQISPPLIQHRRSHTTLSRSGPGYLYDRGPHIHPIINQKTTCGLAEHQQHRIFGAVAPIGGDESIPEIDYPFTLLGTCVLCRLHLWTSPSISDSCFYHICMTYPLSSDR